MPGQIISAGSETLPPPDERENVKPEQTVDVDVPVLGSKVRITYMLRKYRHYKSHYWSWVALRADLIEDRNN
ncbi:MAG: hypothetical protein V4614_15455 [Pseudomonadota bacterium]